MDVRKMPVDLIPCVDDNGKRVRRVLSFDYGDLHTIDFPFAGHMDPSVRIRQDASLVFIPGISPYAVERVDFDAIDYTSHRPRLVHVTFTVFEDDSHLEPDTKDFTTLEEFHAYYRVRMSLGSL